MGTHQRLHRDGIIILTPDGAKKKVYRTGSDLFRCEQPGCGYSSENSCNFQVSTPEQLSLSRNLNKPVCPTQSHAKRHTTAKPYPTPDESSTRESETPDTHRDLEEDHHDPELALFGSPNVPDLQVAGPSEEHAHLPSYDGRDDHTPSQDFTEDTAAVEDEDYDPENEEEGTGKDQTETPKARWSEDTVQTEAMASLGLCVNTLARVIVCIACSSVIRPADLPGHFTKNHSPISISASLSQEFSDTHNLRTNLDSRPGRIISAIYGLQLTGGYLGCDDCGFACKSDKAMARHFHLNQGCKTSRPSLAQTFRPRSKRFYFGVTLEPDHMPESQDPPLDPVSYLKKKYEPTPFSEVPIKSPNSAQDTNHFLEIEKWHLYIEGKRGSEIYEAVRERETRLREAVRICVERFATDVAGKLSKVDHEVKVAMADYIG